MKTARARIYDFLREKGYIHSQCNSWAAYAMAQELDILYIDLRETLEAAPAEMIIDGILEIKNRTRREVADAMEQRQQAVKDAAHDLG